MYTQIFNMEQMLGIGDNLPNLTKARYYKRILNIAPTESKLIYSNLFTIKKMIKF